jgi:hypothetical protein
MGLQMQGKDAAKATAEDKQAALAGGLAAFASHHAMGRIAQPSEVSTGCHCYCCSAHCSGGSGW